MGDLGTEYLDGDSGLRKLGGSKPGLSYLHGEAKSSGLYKFEGIMILAQIKRQIQKPADVERGCWHAGEFFSPGGRLTSYSCTYRYLKVLKLVYVYYDCSERRCKGRS